MGPIVGISVLIYNQVKGTAFAVGGGFVFWLLVLSHGNFIQNCIGLKNKPKHL